MSEGASHEGLGNAPIQGAPGFKTVDVGASPQDIPDKPNELVHTCAPENVAFLLYRDYIFLTAITISSVMLPGTVVWLIPNHPTACNQYVRHFSRAFNAWTGGMSLRFRFLANAFNGGSFRIARFPPNFTREQILGMPLETLTAYSNEDLDPKNTAWSYYEAVDQREVMYHYMAEPDSANPQSFGGWICVYVAGQLVTGNTQGGQVSLYIESAGRYMFAQPAPIALNDGPTTNGPLSSKSLLDLELQTIRGTPGCNKITLQVCASTVNNLQSGFEFASGFNGTDPTSYIAGDVLDPNITPFRTAFNNGNLAILAGSLADNTVSGPGNLAITPTITSHVWPFALDLQTTDHQVVCTTALQPNNVQNTDMTAQDFFEGKPYLYSRNPTTGFLEPKTYWACLDLSRSTVPIPVATAKPTSTTSKLSKLLNESIVIFADLSHRWYGIQTELMAAELAAYNNAGDNHTTFVYTLHSAESPSPIMFLRLSPNGLFTTNAQATDTLIVGQSLSLRYYTTLQDSTPLPGVTAPMRDFFRLVKKANSRSLKYGWTPEKMLAEIEFSV